MKKKKELFLGLATQLLVVSTSVDSFKVVLLNTEYIGKNGSSMSEKQYEKSELRNQKKKMLETLPTRSFLMH